MNTFDLTQYEINAGVIHRNLPPSELYEHAIRFDKGTSIAGTGALVAYSGAKTGRSPKDKRVVRNATSDKEVWWGPVNIPLDPTSFAINRERARDYLNTRERLYCFDGFAGWDPKYRIKIRVICSRPYHALFMHTMLIRPTPPELEEFGNPDFVIYNAGAFPSNRLTPGVGSKTSIDLSLEDRELIILGTEYAGEMKKGVFTVANYLAPARGLLSMHCSATADKQTGRTSLLFGLSGTGKTTLSADPKRHLIGDDEHVWSDDGVFNIEGGCYAKAINLTPENEPDIFSALRFGAVLENVVLEEDRSVDFADCSITENTRGAYPIEFIDNHLPSGQAGHPRHIIMLTADAFGVLPPISRLSPAGAMYHFLSGYTAKVAGTERGVTEPRATFSTCFGAPFMVLHPTVYAKFLGDRIARHQVKVWLVNTGWSGGPYGVGARMKIAHTRRILRAALGGQLDGVPHKTDPMFKLDVPQSVPGVPSEVLNPRTTWSDPAAYDAQARKLARMFAENFRAFQDDASPDVTMAGPAEG